VGRASLLKAWEDACGDANERRKKDSGEVCKSAHSINQECDSANALGRQDKP
jgi:hypothetical protein